MLGQGSHLEEDDDDLVVGQAEAHSLAVLLQGGDEGADADEARLHHQLGHLAHPPDVLGAIRLRESQVVVEAMPAPARALRGLARGSLSRRTSWGRAGEQASGCQLSGEPPVAASEGSSWAAASSCMSRWCQLCWYLTSAQEETQVEHSHTT